MNINNLPKPSKFSQGFSSIIKSNTFHEIKQSSIDISEMVFISTLTFVCLVLLSSTSALLSPKPYTQQSNDRFNHLRYLSTGGPFHESSGNGIDKDTT
ncbi:unnamed protein product [Ambrosiozyma monospora]|uniref:Unnamed protein product n=1 Tax=Ambrosiozyma monospora TaxID=43982 RepID=A0ACB5SV40_AMBMO|nr:unnamed protein product [Ambrosiozyma monospora]